MTVVRVDRAKAALVVVDMQTRLAPAIAGIDAVTRCNDALIRAASRLSVPVAFTEQNPEGLGRTDPALRGLTSTADLFEKMSFDACRDAPLVAWAAGHRRSQIVVTGTEAHVCVLQTAFGLMDAGFQLVLPTDAVGSRSPEDRRAAIARLQTAGALCVTTEMVLFEWLERAGTDDFRALLPVIRALQPDAGRPG